MNYILFILKSAILDFSRNKVRTFLTALGILIGVASVVLLIAFGLGLKAYIKGQFESLGSNLVYVFPGAGGFGFRPGMFGGIRFDDKDRTNLAKIDGVQELTGFFTKTVRISSENEEETIDLFATTPEIFPIRNFEIDIGRVLSQTDVEKRAKVIVLGPKVAQNLFVSKERALGVTVKVSNQAYRVIGILKSKGGGGLGGPDFDSFGYVPYSAATQFNPDKKFIGFYVKAENEKAVSSVREKAKTILDKRYKDEEFSVVEATEILSTVTAIFSVLNTVLVAIGGISLVVGGVGIMNIMYVTVTERIKEIGVRRAVGATKRDILVQFLAEAATLSLLGGTLGLVVAFLIVLVIQRFFPAYIDIFSVIVSLVVSSTVGIVFGVLPAKKAADLSPIEAIRYE